MNEIPFMRIVYFSITIGLVAWLCKTMVLSEACYSYRELTGINTRYIKGNCYMYVNGKLQIVKELE